MHMSRVLTLTPTLVFGCWLPVACWAQVNSGSNGSDGAFNPTTNIVINMADHPTGIYQYTSVNISERCDSDIHSECEQHAGRVARPKQCRHQWNGGCVGTKVTGRPAVARRTADRVATGVAMADSSPRPAKVQVEAMHRPG